MLEMSQEAIWYNLAFQSGGIRTFVHHGALLALEEAGVLQPIKRVAGTSAGAMLAALVAFRLPIKESLAHYEAVDMSRIPQMATDDVVQFDSSIPLVAGMQSQLYGLTKRATPVTRLMKSYGWYSSAYAYSWIRDVIAQQCEGNGDATFGEFRERGFRDLYVIAANISKSRGEIFSAETTPYAPVAAALLISQSIPLFFEAIQFDGYTIGQGDYYADGALVNNFPVDLFDEPRYLELGDKMQSDINWQTLGLQHVTPADAIEANRPIESLRSYMENLSQMVLNMQTARQMLNPLNAKRSIQISNLGISGTDFTVEPKPGNSVYDQLVAEGYTATQRFLATYTPPTILG